jgi:protein SMG6
MEVEMEKDSWRSVALEWFAEGVATAPGEGTPHHH